MSWRKWLVRGLVFAILGAVLAAGWLYQRWTDPAAVRRQVIHGLQKIFVGANITLDSAQLRLLGGVSVTDLRMSRRDDTDRIDFFYIPSAVIYHDKEQLLDGKLAIRKVELFRPRVQVVRDRQGRWNLAGVLGPVDPTVPLPTIVIHQATIVVDDYFPAPETSGEGLPTPVRVEVEDVSFTMVNDPLPVLVFEGKGASELAGPLEFDGTWQRATGATALSLDAPAVPVAAPLVQSLSAYHPKLGEHARNLEGTAAVHAQCHYQPGAERPWSHDLRCQLSQGRLNHPQLPLPLDNLDLSVRYSDGQLTLEKLSAESGDTRLRLSGWARIKDPAGETQRQAINTLTPDPDSLIPDDTDFEAELRVERLPINPGVFRRLPPNLQDMQALFSPAGVVNLNVDFSRRSGVWRKHCRLQPEELSLCFARFPYRLERVQGSIDHRQDQSTHTEEIALNLVGYSDDRPIFIRGKVVGEPATSEVQVDVWGEDIPLNAKLEAALPVKFQTLARSFHPAGLANFVANIRRQRGRREFQNRYVTQFHHAALRFDVFPYPLEDVTGVLDCHDDSWEFRDFHGSHKNGTVHCQGRSIRTAAGDRIAIDIRGTDILLDEELEAALQPRLRQAWQAFRPAGRMSFSAHIDDLPDQPSDLDVSVTVQSCAMRPTFFPCALSDVCGTVRYAKEEVSVGKFSAKCGRSVIGLDRADILLKQGGGFYAKLHGLSGTPLMPEPELLQAMPPALRQAAEALRLKDPLLMNTLLIIDMPSEPGYLPVIYWDGGLTLRDATVYVGVPLEHVTGQVCCRGRHNGRQLEGVVGNLLLDQMVLFKQPFKNVHSHIEIPKDAPDVIRLPDLKAKIFGGDLGGEVRIEHGSTLRYDVNLTALQVKLEELGRHNFGNDAQIQGEAMARLYLTGRGAGVEGLEGNGSVDIPSGKLYNLPILLDLLKVIGLRPPDRTAFEEAHATFGIHGPRVTVNRLDLYGHAISLSGQGEMALDGSDVQIDFYAVWGRIVQVLPPILKELPPTLGQFLLKVKVRGKLGDVQFTKEPVPILCEPLERLIKRFKKDGKEPQPGERRNPGEPRGVSPRFGEN